MNQSPDDIFAAHFWSWPDPALKRDGHGRVLFVNAAFLQLFGGSVEDWRGQTVGGWHVPQPNGGPARFELRTPATPTLGEQVYDWVELPGADGAAFALARNVTPFLAQSTTPPGAEAHPVESDHAEPDAHYAERQSHDPVDAAPTFEAAQDDIVTASEPLSAPPSTQDLLANAADMQADIVTGTVAEPAPVATAPAAATVTDVPALDIPEISVPPIEAAPRTPTPSMLDVDMPAPAADAPAPAPAPVATAAPAPTPARAEAAPTRDFERRALPIENDEAVLGNNWRDAVIAKAVGAVEPKVEATPEVETPAVTEGPKDAIRILLAEDNAINALLTRTLLEADGHTVETVEDGVQAVEAMKTSSFDLIFMDMRMPNMDGLEATRKIRALVRVPASLPIIALTANAFDDDRNACFDSGMNDFMTKPVSAEELSEMVQRWAFNNEQALAS